jgi:hypothetical protein
MLCASCAVVVAMWRIWAEDDVVSSGNLRTLFCPEDGLNTSH